MAEKLPPRPSVQERMTIGCLLYLFLGVGWLIEKYLAARR